MHLITKPVKFRNIILPDDSFFYDEDTGQRYFSNEYLETIEQIRNFALKNKTPVDNKKLFLYYGRNSLNEQRLAKYFQEKGYAVILPENIPLAAQLNLYINCESFASTIGSCSHNMIFTPTNSEVILIPRGYFANGYQETFDQLHERKIFYIDSTLSVFAPNHVGPYFFILSKQLKEYFGETWNGEYTAQDFEEFLMYVILSLNNGRKTLCTDAVKYYDKVFFDFINQLKKRPDLMKKYNVTFQ